MATTQVLMRRRCPREIFLREETGTDPRGAHCVVVPGTWPTAAQRLRAVEDRQAAIPEPDDPRVVIIVHATGREQVTAPELDTVNLKDQYSPGLPAAAPPAPAATHPPPRPRMGPPTPCSRPSYRPTGRLIRPRNHLHFYSREAGQSGAAAIAMHRI